MKQRPKTTVRDLRRQNRRLVLEHAYFAQSISRWELSQVIGLSPATVTNVVSELLEEQILLETGLAESQGGRPRTILTPNPHYGAFIGIDVGETEMRIELLDLTLTKLGGLDYPLRNDDPSGKQIATQIGQGIDQLVASSGIERERVLGVGVGVPGIVERGKTELINAATWGWQALPLSAMLAEQVRLPIFIDNGAKAMAQAELWFGAGRNVESLIVLLLGTGAGAGIIANGQVYRGVTNSAGEWGHTRLVLDGWQCRCGIRGCLEAYVGAPGIIRQYCELAPESRLARSDDEAANVAAILAAAQSGEGAALQVMNQVARDLGAKIADLVNLFNPQLILLGGWSGLLLGPELLPKLTQVTEQYALRQPFEAVQLGLCDLGQDAICMGAATLVLDAFLKSGGLLQSAEGDSAKSRDIPAAIYGALSTP